MIAKYIVKAVLIFTGLFISAKSFCQSTDLSQAIIYTPDIKNVEIAKPVQVLREEVKKRTAINLHYTTKVPIKNKAVIAIIPEDQLSKIPTNWKSALVALPETGKEGFKILSLTEEPIILITGKDKRSLLYGIGWLLRKASMRKNSFLVTGNLSVSSSPQLPIRGHQLGYRPKTNAYDAFSVAQFDQYIRDLALFGANSIEIVPPRTDDDATSPHMKLEPINMIAEQSRICKDYGLDVWMWYPNMGPDYTNPDSIKNELAERRAVFAAVPKLDALFVPGGDPGELEPGTLFNWLEKVAAVLHEKHPAAKIWVSPQVFRPTQKWTDDFYIEVNKKYNWFGGVVFGPWINTPVQDVRAKTDAAIPIRMYPDITHSLSSQYPVENWDLAYAMTLGRECINPRPNAEKHIQNIFARYGAGSISYSEGTNDDVNKFVWSAQDWDTTTPVIETLRDYARLFIGPDYAESVAQGIINLEKNFDGPLLVNETVPLTLQQWQAMENNATQQVRQNFRFQMCLLRAYYDRYIQQRLIVETALEQKAINLLATANNTNSLTIISQARKVMTDDTHTGVNTEYRDKCFALADSLYKSIGAQLTIKKHGAADGRGNFIDNIEVPLNDSPWLLDQMDAIEKIHHDEERMGAIYKLLHRTDPGPGGFYDNFGLPASWKRIVTTTAAGDDPGGIVSPSLSFGVGTKEDEWVHEIRPIGFGGKITPRAWMTQVNTLYNQPLQIEYNALDTTGAYHLRIAYTGRFRSKMKLTANNIRIHDYMLTGDNPVYEVDLPKAITATGKVRFTWVCPDGEQGAQVSEIWLIRK